jgi:hypothetical protein
MSPQKPFDLILDDIIDIDIQDWQEERADFGTSVEPEQLEFDD